MARKRCMDSARTAGTVMRVLVCLNFFAALCLLIFGCTVERPINSFPPVAMILLALSSVAAAITGLVGGHKWACCLDAFLVIHGLNTLCQLILVIVLWADFQGVVNAIDPRQTGKYDRAHVTDILKAAKWLMLVFMLCEMAALVLSLLLRFVLDPPSLAAQYDNFDEASMQDKSQSISSLRIDVEAGSKKYSTSNNSVYAKIKDKMARKYGDVTHFKWKKSWFGL
eukprot:GHRR01007530.1.p1 GENE.GHRR01007530.1~~GHRR01007530.1.p1  ORF type:complete len:225 (+),score=39.99 GHRR01007530.1:124-798(+)